MGEKAQRRLERARTPLAALAHGIIAERLAMHDEDWELTQEGPHSLHNAGKHSYAEAV